MKKVLILFVSIALSAVSAVAQRTAYGEYLASGSILLTNTSLGAEASFGSYLMDGYWSAGVNVANRAAIEEISREVVSFPRVEIFGALLWAPYRTRSRSVNTYIGGDIFVGWELMDPLKSTPSHIIKSLKNAGYSSARFIYGGAIRAEVEWFVSDQFALTAILRTPAAFRSKLKTFNWEAGIGIRQNF